MFKYLFAVLLFSSVNASQDIESIHRKVRLDREITRCILMQRVEVLNDSIDKITVMLSSPECPAIIFSDNVRMIEDRSAIIRLIHLLGRFS